MDPDRYKALPVLASVYRIAGALSILVGIGMTLAGRDNGALFVSGVAYLLVLPATLFGAAEMVALALSVEKSARTAVGLLGVIAKRSPGAPPVETEPELLDEEV